VEGVNRRLLSLLVLSPLAFGRQPDSDAFLSQILLPLSPLAGAGVAALCRSFEEVCRRFLITSDEVTEIKRYIYAVRRRVKFLNENTAIEHNLVNHCLNAAGKKLREPTMKGFRETLAKRVKLAPAVYKLIGFGLTDERARITKMIRNVIECRCLVLCFCSSWN